MKNCKGSKKEFTRYIQSEIDDDYYLEPLESGNFLINDTESTSKFEPRRCRCKSFKKCYHLKFYYDPYPRDKTTIYSQYTKNLNPSAPIKNSEPARAKVTRKIGTRMLTDEMIRTCISNLRTDAKNCYYGLQEFKIIEDVSILEKFKAIYRGLETINILYLSVAHAKESEKIEAVYLWQMSEKCPCVKGEEKQPSILTDVKSNLTNTQYFPSLLLLAKITPEAGEEILEAKILQDNKLLIQSKINTFEFVYKIFNIISFEQSARVNPLQQNISANSLYTWKLRVHPSSSEDAENTMQVNVWKKYTLEEEMDQTTPIDEKKVHERSYNATPPSSLSFVAYSHHGWTILLDKTSSVFIVWRENDIHIFSFTEMMGTTQTFEVIKETLCVLINTKGQVFTFKFCELPSRVVQATPHTLPIAAENPTKIQLLGVRNGKNSLKSVGLAYFWEGKFYCVDIMGTEPANVLLDLKDEALPQGFSSWTFVEKPQQRVLFYIKDGVLNIYDLEKSRHQTQKLLFENSQQKPRDWQIYAGSPNALYVHTVGTPEMFAREIYYNGEIDAFFKDEDAIIRIQYFAGESPISGNKNIAQIETPSRGNSIFLIRMKEPVFQDDFHLVNYDGPLYYIPPNVSTELAQTPENRERCPYQELVDRVERIQKLAERYLYDEKCAEEAEQIQKDLQELIKKRTDEKKDQQGKYEEYLELLRKRKGIGKQGVSEPEEIDYKKYLDLYKCIKQVQKSLKAAKMRQSARPKNDVI